MPNTCDPNVALHRKLIWIISECPPSDLDLTGVFEESVDDLVREYNISALGRYLLNPNSIEVKKKLIGGEIHYRQSKLDKIRRSIYRMLPASFKRRKKGGPFAPEVVVSRYKLRLPAMNDPEFNAHLNHIYDQLKSYDSVTKRLASLDPHNIFQIVGICEDVGGNYSYLKLQGSIEEKIKYLNNHITKDVGVILNKAYVDDGLYELRGYDFKSYDPSEVYRLCIYNSGGIQKACVLTRQNKVDFYIVNMHLLKHMLLLEHSLKANPGLSEAFELCTSGQANPVKLFFNKKLEIDYSKSPLPTIYQDVLKTHNLRSNHRNLIKPILNYLQIGISLNYLLATDGHNDRMYTHISVLHDLRALEPLRKNLPRVYDSVAKHGFATETGQYYVLDSINGYNNG